MALDASIYNNIQQPRPVNLLADYANLMQVQGAQQANQLNRLKMDEYTRGVERQNKLTSLLQGAPDDQVEPALMRGGFLKEAMEFGKSRDERARAKVGADTDAFKLAKDRYGMYQQTLGSLAQEPNLSRDLVLQAGQGLVQQGVLPAALFEQAAASLPDDPVQLRAKLTQSIKTQLSPEQMLTLFAPKAEKVDNGQQIGFRDTNPLSPTYGQATAGAAVQKVASPDAQLSAETSRRGQNMTDARAREANNNAKAPAGYRWSADGQSLEPIPGGPATKDSGGTEGERNAAGYAGRMAAAEQIIGKVSKADPGSQTPGLIEQATGGVGMVANASRSETRQQYRQAQEDWVRAKLRKESGAAIPNDEMEREISVYFPQINDKPAVIKQKAEARKVAEQGMRQAAGRAAPKGAADGAWDNNDPLGLRR